MANAERRKKARENLTQELLTKSVNLQRKYESEIQHRFEEIAKLELIRKIRLETRTSNNKFGFRSKGKKKAKHLHEKEEGAITGGDRDEESAAPTTQVSEQQEISFDTYTNGSYNYMTNDYMTSDYMTNDHTTNDHTTNDHTTTDYMTNDYMTNDYMTNDYMTNDYMTNDYMTNDYTTNENTPVTDHSCSYMNSSYLEGSVLSKYTNESYNSCCSECNRECIVLEPDDLLPYSGKPCLQDPCTSVRFHDETVAPLFPTIDCTLCPCETCDESCSKLPVTLMFIGCCTTKTVKPTEIHIEQQYNCEAVFCVYEQCHYINDTFTFISHHEHNFPFILYIYLNGMLHMKINTCCEYKHLPGYRLGGKRGQFLLVDVKGTSSCTLCEESFTKFQEEASKSTIGVENIKMEEDIVIDVPHDKVAEICVPVENTGMSMIIDLQGKKPKLKAIQRDTFEEYDSEQTSSSPPCSVLSGSSTCQCNEVMVQGGKEVEHKSVRILSHSVGIPVEETESSHSPCSAESPVDEVTAEKYTSNLSCLCSQHSDHHHHSSCHCLHRDSSISSNARPCVRIGGGGGNSSGSGRESVGSNIAGGAINTGEKSSAVTNEDGNYKEDNDVTADSGNAKVDDTAVKHVEEKDFDGDDEDNISVGDNIQSVSQHDINEAEQHQEGQQQSPQLGHYYQNSNENNSLKRTSPQDSVSQVLYLDTNLLSMKLEQLQQQQQQEGLLQQVEEEEDQPNQEEDQSCENRNKKDQLKADSLQDTDGLHEIVEPVPDDVEVEDNNTIHTCSISSNSSSNNNNSEDDTGSCDNVSINDIINSDDNVNNNDVNNSDDKADNVNDTVDNNPNATTNNHINNNNNDHNNNNTGSTPLDLVHKSIQVMLLDERGAVAKAHTSACTSEMGTQVTIKDMQKQQLDKSSDFRKSKDEEDTVSLITKLENSVLWKNTNFVLPESALQKQKTGPS